MKPTKIAVILSGCGVFDGSEIQETVLCLLRLDQKQAQVQCFAPNMPQAVIDHTTEAATDEVRNVWVESARITRGNLQPLDALNPEDFDGLIIPGGFGVAKNLSDFATQGANLSIHHTLLEKARGFIQQDKVLGLLCIAPVLAGVLYQKPVQCTIGNDPAIAAALEKTGARHVVCSACDIVVDHQHKLVSTPAYMLGSNIAEVANGIFKLIDIVLELATS